MNEIPRGLRNNNPLNIKKSSTAWQGKVEGKDENFETFRDIFWGCRAAIINLRTHLEQDRHCLIRTTIAREIRKWAPDSENNTQAYINYVVENMKVPADTKLKFSDKNTVCCLLYWMARYENGRDADVHLYWFERAYEMV